MQHTVSKEFAGQRKLPVENSNEPFCFESLAMWLDLDNQMKGITPNI